MRDIREFLSSDYKNMVLEGETPTPEMLTKVQEALPELQKLILDFLGIRSKTDLGLTAKMGRDTIDVESKDIRHLLGDTLVNTLFDEFKIVFWGGSYSPKNNVIYFAPHASFHYVSGGSNGTDILWSSIDFDLDKNQWVVSYPIKAKK